MENGALRTRDHGVAHARRWPDLCTAQAVMSFLSRALLRLGYVRLRDYGYTMTSEGRIVELPRVTDDRFAPPPWEPIAWQSATAFLPPESPPVPRPLPPAPAADQPISAARPSVHPETRPPVAGPVTGTVVGAAGAPTPTVHVSATLAPPPTPARTEPEDEEWEWRMALARARERAAREAARSGAARRGTAELRIPPHPDTAGDATSVALTRTPTQIGTGAASGPHDHPRSSAPRVSSPTPHPTSAMLARPTGSRSPSIHDDPDRTGTRLLDARDPALDGSDFAEGSRRHPITRSEPGDVTAADISLRPDEDATTVDATANHLARSLQPGGEGIDDGAIEPTSPIFVPPPAPAVAPLPRATTRLRK